MARIVVLLALMICSIGSLAPVAYASTTLQVSPILVKYELEPGQTTNKTITTTNKGDSPVSITTDISDYSVNSDGVPKFVKPSRNPLSAGNWMHVDSRRFTLQPGESKDVELFIEVPKTATAGGHYGAVLFELGGIDKKTGQIQVGVVGRMAALSLVTIAGDVNKKGSLEKATIPFFSNAHPVPIELDYSNSGNVHLDTRGTLVVKNWFGSHVKDVLIPESYVMPGSRKTIKTAMTSGSLAGFYKAEFKLQEKSIKTPDGPIYFVVFPWTLALGVLFIIASIFLLGRRQGRKASKANKNSE
jgi:uncharacterized membrane protein